MRGRDGGKAVSRGLQVLVRSGSARGRALEGVRQDRLAVTWDFGVGIIKGSRYW